MKKKYDFTPKYFPCCRSDRNEDAPLDSFVPLAKTCEFVKSLRTLVNTDLTGIDCLTKEVLMLGF